MKTWRFDALFDGVQWLQNVAVTVDADGRVVEVEPDASNGERVAGTVLPAMVNVHGHAFQRAFAGRAERRGPTSQDSFWTWREQMYAAARTFEPETLEATAAALYRELREDGFASVVEFHYLHHRPDGRPHDEPLAMSRAVIRAADAAGVRLCLLPVLFERPGFFDVDARPEVARFVLSVSEYLDAVDALREELVSTPHRTGFAFHSLRAVTLESMDRVLAHRRLHDPTAPVHVHAAEQPSEVDDCLRAHGRRPVALLLDRFELDSAWCVVHATHTKAHEIRGLADRGVVVGLCPVTEANLGDGLFDLAELLASGGRFGVGTDAHVSTSPFEELRWLEYGQRLRRGRRNIVDSPTPHVGTNLWSRALEGGAAAAGLAVGRIGPGAEADWLVYRDRELRSLPVDERIDALVFAPRAPRPETWIGGHPPDVAAPG